MIGGTLVAVAESYNPHPANPGWEGVTGTSLATPLWAGLIALVNQGRAAAGRANFNSIGPQDVMQALYSLPRSDFHDDLGGDNGTTADGLIDPTRYDKVTGLGSPAADLLVPDLINYEGFTHFGLIAPAAVLAGVPFGLTVVALDANNNIVTDYQGTVTFSTTDGDPGVVLPAAYTFTAADGGMHTFTAAVSFLTPGDQTLMVIDTDGYTGSTRVTVTPPPLPPGGGRAQELGGQGMPQGMIVQHFSAGKVQTASLPGCSPIKDAIIREALPRSEAPSPRRLLQVAREEATDQFFANWRGCLAPAFEEQGAIDRGLQTGGER
jgi:hypothetical protein